jgi:hypothetical protein
MSKKPAAPLIRFSTPSSPREVATRTLTRVAQAKRKLYVEVPDAMHQAVRFRALDKRTTVTEYILELVEARKGEAVSAAPFPSAARQKRLVLDLSAERAEKVQSAADPFGSFRQMVLACLELDGIAFPRAAIDEKLLQAGVASGKFAADHYGKTLDEESGRAAWTIFCRLSSRDERYQRDEENFKAFLAAATKAGRAALKEERAAS